MTDVFIVLMHLHCQNERSVITCQYGIWSPQLDTLTKQKDLTDSFIVGSRSFICILKSKGPTTDPWKNQCFIVPHFPENFSKVFISVFFVSICQRRSEPVSYCPLNTTITITSLAKFYDLHSQKLLLNHRIFPQHAFFG